MQLVCQTFSVEVIAAVEWHFIVTDTSAWENEDKSEQM